MRPVMLSDVTAAARVLLGVAAAQREECCVAMLREAEHADRYTRRLGRLHPVWGNGTLLAAARTRRLQPEPSFDNLAYCACVEMVLRTLRHRRQGIAKGMI